MSNQRIYDKHFLMNIEDIKAYVVDYLQLFDDKEVLEVSEIGDGNINYVYLVLDKNTGKSVVIKQADTLLRSSGRPLDLSRNRIEAEILNIQNELAVGYVPEVYDYNEKMFAVTMENISAYKNMRYELIEQKVFPDFSEQISDFLTKTLLPTTDLILDHRIKKERVASFINIDMCEISEDLVLREPYDDYKGRNIITPGNEHFVATHLYQDEALHAEVACLRNNYMNNAQALLHGDLHTGSIFINQAGIKIIDPEFAFYGPMGYDIGNVLAHLYFPLVLAGVREAPNVGFEKWLLNCTGEIYDKVLAKLNSIYRADVTAKVYQNNAFQAEYLSSVMADALGYAGTEIIRRVVGDSKVRELSLLPVNRKIEEEQLLISWGIRLIKERKKLCDGQALMDGFIECREGV